VDKEIVYAYRYWPELRRRAQLMIDCFERKLDTVFDVRRLEPPGVVNVSRACGACRAGDDTFTSVLDRDNRAHDLDNMYVLDASFFPSSARSWPQLSGLD
jgi:choline dehydrogenase-like flavoprotein